MRVQHWLATLVGASGLLLGAQHGLYAQDQSGSYQVGSYQVAPAQPGQVLAPSGPPASYNASLAGPEYNAYPQVIPPVPPQIGPNGVDGSTIQPYPTTSPFDEGYTSFMNLGGIWDRIQRNTDRHWYFNADMLFISTRATPGLFGNPGAQSYNTQERDFINGGSSDTSNLLQNQGYIVNTPSQIFSYFNNYNAVNLNNLGDPATQGARFTFGDWNPDGSGWAWTFWFGATAAANFNAAQNDGFTQHPQDTARLYQIIRFLQNASPETLFTVANNPDAIDSDLGGVGNKDLTASQILQMDLLNLRGLPVADGTPRGQTIPYDIYFDVKTTTSQIGTHLDYYFTPFFERKWITVSASAGVEYMNIRESLSFLGVDSGMLYSTSTTPDRDYKEQSLPNGIDDNQDGIIDNAGFAEPGPAPSTSSSGGSSGSSSSSSDTFIFTFPSPFALLPATIDVTANTNLVGPTAGLRYTVGGKDFHVTGETKFGLMANFETIQVQGNNIGSTTRVNGTIVNFPTTLSGANGNPQAEYQQDLFIPSPSDLNPNAFDSSAQHSHISPLISQSLTVEAPVFQYVPVLGKMWPFSTANLRGGWELIWVGDVIETNESIDYQGDPMAGLYPRIVTDHGSWWTQNWSFGASWSW